MLSCLAPMGAALPGTLSNMTATLELFTTALSTSPVLADGGDGGRGLFTIYGPASAGGLLVYVITVIGLWGMFRKANRAGWLALIPIVNLWNTLRVAGRTGWMILLYLIPIVNIVVAAIIAFDLGRKFGRGESSASFCSSSSPRSAT